MNSNIYWERQSGNLCRLHSINAYFGFKKLDKNAFVKEYFEDRFNISLRHKDVHYYKLEKTFISSFISLLSTLDSFLPFTLLLTFLHASMQGLHGFADLL